MKRRESYTYEEQRERVVFDCDRDGCDNTVMMDEIFIISRNPQLEVVDGHGNPYPDAIKAIEGEPYEAFSGDRITFEEESRVDLCPKCNAELNQLIQWFIDGGQPQ